MDDIAEKVRAIIAAQMDRASVDDAQNLIEDLGGDSLDLIELTLRLRDAFGETLPDLDLPDGATVGNIINFVKEHTNG